jgi:hypothetical protein
MKATLINAWEKIKLFPSQHPTCFTTVPPAAALAADFEGQGQ